MEQSPVNSVNPDVRARIISAIEELYDQLGRGDQFPTVSDVRARARADMNTCSTVFREWKRQQTAKPAPVAVDVPEPVKAAHIEAVGIVWNAAQEQANASLREAEAKWELERGDNETMRRELADAYEGAVTEADQARSALGEALRAKDSLTQQNQQLAQQLAEAREGLAQQTTRADENERRANDLKDELRVAHDEAVAVRQELSQARLTHLAELDQQKGVAAEQIERLNESLATTRARLEAANEQSEGRQKALSDALAKLAQAQAQADTANDELQRVRTALEGKQQQAEGLQQQAATIGAQLTELQRSHTALQADVEKSRQVADESSRELARTAGVLQEVQRQNNELMARLSPAKGRQQKSDDDKA
ncbi:TPA: DNA-binding protein [Pseudomonas aeruginosa]|nr:DNA-binding protein [Pseudomonas aeruginosa]